MKSTGLIRRFTIRTRMVASVLLITLVLLGVGSVGVAAQWHARQVNASFIAQDFAAMTHIARLRTAMSTMRSHEKDMIIQYERSAEIANARKAWSATLEDVHAIAASLGAALHDDAERARLAEAMARLQKFKQAFLPVALNIERSSFDSAPVAAQFMKQAQPDYDAAQRLIDALASDLERGAASAGRRLDTVATSVMLLLAAAVVMALLLITPFTIINMRSICKPISVAVNLAEAITRGDLADSQVDSRGNDEAAQLLRALASMQGSLRDIVGQVRTSSDAIGAASTQIAAGSADLSTRTEQTAASLQ